MNRGRKGIVFVLIAALLVSAAARSLGERQRHATALLGQSGASSNGSSLSGMNSFALALLLGGLRGPLVMLLWSNSEAQKMEKNLEGLDTQIEWIRLLQPEFDTVHIFQIWNKAYNVSVQMASLANKYLVILDALEYAHNIDRDRPDNINTMVSMGQVYTDKLGQSSEKAYYRKRVREETQPHKAKQKLSRNDPGWRRLEIDPMLDADGNILPGLLAPHGAPLEENGEKYDGSELQFLAKYQPFHEGIDPNALGYNYYKRGQVLGSVGKQRHAQLGDTIVDSRPAMTLKQWADAEAENARRNEFAAYGLPVPIEKDELELPTGDFIKLDSMATNPAAMKEAIAGYRLTARLCSDSIAEFERHIKAYISSRDTYLLHIDTLKPMGHLATADADYLQAIGAPSDQKAALLKSAKENYLEAIDGYILVILRYYVDPQLSFAAFGKPMDAKAANEATPQQRAKMLEQLHAGLVQFRGRRDDSADDRAEFERYILRAQLRLKNIENSPTTSPSK